MRFTHLSELWSHGKWSDGTFFLTPPVPIKKKKVTMCKWTIMIINMALKMDNQDNLKAVPLVFLGSVKIANLNIVMVWKQK